MKNIISLSFIVMAAMLMSSCEKVVDIDLETSESKPVVEGLVTDQPGRSYVKLTHSDSYFKVQNLGRITGAKVEVSDDNGNITVFTETLPGYYQPDAAFTGKVNQTYTLKVVSGGKTLVAHSFMRRVTEIEKINTRFFESNNSEGKEEGYYVYVSFFELQGKGDSYKIDMFVNGKSNVERPGDLFYFDDRFVDGGHAIDWEFPQKVAKGDTITLKMYSLSEEGYKFYDAIYQITDAGGLFGKSPANVPTNIQGDAFGYFGASAMSEKSTIVQ